MKISPRLSVAVPACALYTRSSIATSPDGWSIQGPFAKINNSIGTIWLQLLPLSVLVFAFPSVFAHLINPRLPRHRDSGNRQWAPSLPKDRRRDPSVSERARTGGHQPVQTVRKTVLSLKKKRKEKKELVSAAFSLLAFPNHNLYKNRSIKIKTWP